MLQQLRLYHWVVLILSVLSLAGGIAVWHVKQTPVPLDVVASKIQKTLNNWEASFSKITENKPLILKAVSSNYKPVEVQTLYDQFYTLLLYRNDTLVFWNNNKVLPPDSFLYSNSDATRLVKLPNGYYQLCKKTLPLQTIDGNLQKITAVALQLIKYNYAIQNKNLSNTNNPLLGIPTEIEFSLPVITNIATTNDTTVSDNKTDSILSKKNVISTTRVYTIANATQTDFLQLNYNNNLLQKRVDYVVISLQLLGIIGLLFCITLLCLQINKQNKRPLEASILLVTLFLLVKALMVVFDLPNTLHQTQLFSVKQYSRYILFISPGDLLINIIGLSWIVAFLYQIMSSFKWYKQYKKNTKWHFVLYLLIVSISFISTYGLYYIIKIFFYYFNIKIDIINILYSSSFSLSALLSMGFLWIIYVLLLQNLARTVAQLAINRWQHLAGIGLILFLYIPILYFFKFSWSHLLTLVWLIVFINSIRYFSIALYPSLTPMRLFAYVFFFSILFTLLIYHFTEQRSFENSKRFAGKLAIQEDPITEDLLGAAALNIITDNDLVIYFQNKRVSKIPESLSQYLKRTYLNSQHFERYEIDIAAFDNQHRFVDKTEQRITTEEDYQYKTINQLRTNNSYIYLIRGEPGSYNYLAKLPIFDTDNIAGYIYIEMRPKLDKSNVYPELTLEDQYRQTNESLDYKYAIYSNKILESSLGSYPYPYRQDSNFISQVTSTIRDTVFTVFEETQANGKIERKNRDTILVNYSSTSVNQHKHLLYNLPPQKTAIVSQEKTVIVSQEKQTIFSLLSLFIYIYTILLLSFIIVIIFISITKGVSSISFIKNLLYSSLRRRINMLLVTVLLVSFVAIGAATTSYFFNLSDQHNRENLIQKQSEILRAIENNVRHNPNEQTFTNLINDPLNVDYFNALSKELSEIYSIDINVFNKYGQLISTSQPLIFTQHLVSKQLNPYAYHAIVNDFENQFVQTEQIGKLSYIASYMPLKDKQNELVGFLNLPYFAREKEFRNEISRFLTQIINIYVLLLIIGLVLAVFVSNTITNPLLMISAKLRGIQLGKKNELLSWPDNDEIGALVQQYNTTIKELESSVKLLAQSERQNAWQSMARQVAHEIKNPLTPMKLGIEHLQRAYRDKHPNVQQMTEKILVRLIEQIDLLSQIATEFSNFAKMPKPNNENIDLKAIINNVIGLYNDAQEAHLYAKLPDRPCFVYADKNQLIRVFTNLIKNAIQAIPPNQKGVIVVNVKLNEKTVIIAVADNGTGISHEMREKVFNPNFTTKNSGMGLGLAMSQSIIEAAKGKIWFESEVNIGTTFFVRLPLIQPKQEFIEL